MTVPDKNLFPIARSMLERYMFPDTTSLLIFGTNDMPNTFLYDNFVEVYSNLATKTKTPEFRDFFFKFSLMT